MHLAGERLEAPVKDRQIVGRRLRRHIEVSQKANDWSRARGLIAAPSICQAAFPQAQLGRRSHKRGARRRGAAGGGERARVRSAIAAVLACRFAAPFRRFAVLACRSFGVPGPTRSLRPFLLLVDVEEAAAGGLEGADPGGAAAGAGAVVRGMSEVLVVEGADGPSGSVPPPSGSSSRRQSSESSFSISPPSIIRRSESVRVRT
jgi:hypothetical protein